MSLKDTYNHLRNLLSDITVDLAKAEHGNKAASQRVRTGTVKLEKLAKKYRKESITAEKKGSGAKKPAKAASKAKPKAKAKAPASKSKAPVAKAHAAKAVKGRSSPVAVKRASAKAPVKKKR